MALLQISGSPRTAARQFVELLTRDNILDEDGNVNESTVEAACRYAGGPRGMQYDLEWTPPQTHDEACGQGNLYVDGKLWSPPVPPNSPGATDGSTQSGRSETPEPICEQCTQEEPAQPADTSRIHSSAQGANTTDTQDSPEGHPASFPVRRAKDLWQLCD